MRLEFSASCAHCWSLSSAFSILSPPLAWYFDNFHDFPALLVEVGNPVGYRAGSLDSAGNLFTRGIDDLLVYRHVLLLIWGYSNVCGP